jgi:hypothetical protein
MHAAHLGLSENHQHHTGRRWGSYFNSMSLSRHAKTKL